jgi:hypothetical protein
MQNLSSSQVAELARLTDQWNNATSQAQRDAAHAQANAIRQSAGTGVTFNANGTANAYGGDAVVYTGVVPPTNVAVDSSGGVVAFSKTSHTQGDSGLRDVSDEEVSRRARDRTLSGEERRRYQTEEKLRGQRNKQKRGSNFENQDPILPTLPVPGIKAKTSYKVIGVGLIIIGVAGTIILLADDVTGVGVLDDPFIGATGGLVLQGAGMLVH